MFEIMKNERDEIYDARNYVKISLPDVFSINQVSRFSHLNFQFELNLVRIL